MKFIPALFNTDMVVALLQNRKTQTRRLTNLQLVNENPDDWQFKGFGPNPVNEDDKRLYAYFMSGVDCWHYALSPYGNVGDVLWVREAFCVPNLFDGTEDDYYYKASVDIRDKDVERYIIRSKWMPNIFMPKRACRIFLRITKVRVERLNDITEADAIAEGIEVIEKDEAYKNYDKRFTGWSSCATARGSYFSLIEAINGKGIIAKIPFMWVYDFEQIEQPAEFEAYASSTSR